MCINPVDDIDSAYGRMNVVLKPETIWKRWVFMYRSPKTSWFKGMITIDTSVKPKEGVNDDGNALDIQWNVYVILLLRRHNLISIKSMVYDADKESYKIRIDILDS